MATLLDANRTPVPCAPLSPRPACVHPAVQRAVQPAKPAMRPDFLRELHGLLAGLGQR